MKIINKISATLREYKRILRRARKPNRQEFTDIIKVCGLGIVIIGFIGFFIQMIRQLITGV